jgi:2-hydroxychromene-2-carboxylate isomerase
MPTIEFFYDFSSPYSYLAAMKLPEVAHRTGATLRYRPFVLGAVFKAAGNHMPAEIAAKAAYQLKDLQAWANDYGVPFNFPDVFPLNAIKAARMAVALETEADRAKLTERVYKAYWGENKDITDVGVLAQLANEAGFDGAALVARTDQQAVKDALRANTDDAIARGSFGAPTMFVGEQMFIGNDRLVFVERAAKGEQIYR